MAGPHLPNPQRRSERARRAIVDAAFRLSSEQGYGRLTVEGIAARAGVGKQTIYRWWHSKGAVMLDALVSMTGPSLGFPDTGDVAADVCSQLSTVVGLMLDPALGPAYTGLIADSQDDPVMADALYNRLIGPRIDACAERLAAAQGAGQVVAGIDLDVTAELLYGPIYHRLLLHSGPLSKGHVASVVDLVFGGLRPRRGPGGGYLLQSPPCDRRETDASCQVAGTDIPGPRSRQAILRSAYDLCATHGFHALTIEAIAAGAGVGKQTIYRWWPSKGAVVLDALLEVMQGGAIYPDTGEVVADLRTRLCTLVPLYTSQGFGSIYTGLIAASQFDPKLADDLYGRLVAPRMAACRRRLLRAQRQGQIDPSVDPQRIVELLYGAVHHRLLLHGRPLTADYVDLILDLAFSGAGSRSAPSATTGARRDVSF